MSFTDRSAIGDENYIVAHWKGYQPLVQAYWLNGVLVSIVVNLLFVAALSWLEESEVGITVSAGAAILLAILSLSVSVWVWVGIWRSASKSNSGWAALAKASVVLGVFGLVGQLGSTIQWGSEAAQLAVGSDPLGDMAEVKVERNELRLTGVLTNGVGELVADALAASPNVSALRVNSGGGRLYEAERIGKLAVARNLDVIVDGECSSACTIILLSGKLRAAEAGSAVGFHRPDFPGMTTGELKKMADQLGDTYMRLGLRSSFVDRALDVPPTEMWYPKEEELFDVKVLNGFTPDRVVADLKSEAAQINRSVPANLDELTILTGARAEGLNLKYEYKLTVLKDEINPNFAKLIFSDIKKRQCSRPLVPQLIRAGAKFQYYYSDKSGRYVGGVEISSCD